MGSGDDRGVTFGSPLTGTPGGRNERIHSRVYRVKRILLAAAVAGFGALWALAAQHAVGVTAGGNASAATQSTPTPSVSQQPDSGGFFGNSDPNAVGPGGGNGTGPAVGSGAS